MVDRWHALRRGLTLLLGRPHRGPRSPRRRSVAAAASPRPQNSNLVLTAEQRTSVGREPDGSAETLWGRMAGRMGSDQITVHGLEMIAVDVEKNEIWVKGAVPGARGGMVLLSADGPLTFVEAVAVPVEAASSSTSSPTCIVLGVQ